MRFSRTYTELDQTGDDGDSRLERTEVDHALSLKDKAKYLSQE